jgi:hypothetical protein
MVLAALDVVTLKVVSVPATPAIFLDDDATVAVALKDRQAALRPVGRQRLFPGRSLPCHD